MEMEPFQVGIRLEMAYVNDGLLIGALELPD
jgi:hypothetical protein